MSSEDYDKARKLGLKESHARMQRHENPYLAALEDTVESLSALPHRSLGLVRVPLKKMVGTATRGRSNAFAANFMPIMDPGSEFANKWSALYEGILADGMTQPVKALEYLNRFYLVEGNKRVSVMKYLDSLYVEAEVTRVTPPRTEDTENRIYYEFLQFYADTKINDIWFSKPGGFEKLYALTGKQPGTAWTGDERRALETAYMRFREVYKAREAHNPGAQLPGTTGDAFLIYLEACGYQEAAGKFNREIESDVKTLWGEFEKDGNAGNVALVMASEELKSGGGLFNTLFGPAKAKVAFLYDRQPERSGWVYWHDLGRVNLENELGDRVKTTAKVCEDPQGFEQSIEELIAAGNDMIFTTSPLMLSASIKASVKHPGARILNCSLLASWQRIRSYYLRIYEVKFLMGLIAGAMTENDKIGYIADYPIAGVASSVSAFAMGARMVNPRAKVVLAWSTEKGFDPQHPFADESIQVISGRDVSAPSHSAVEYGLYTTFGGVKSSLAIPVLDWSRIYVSLVQSLLKGNWVSDGAQSAKAVNYWWGLSSDAVDLVMSQRVDAALKRLVELVLAHIREGVFWPFEGIIRDQTGAMRCPVEGRLTPAEVISMDWLIDNVVGGFPETASLREDARALVELQGIREIKLPDASSFSWRVDEEA